MRALIERHPIATRIAQSGLVLWLTFTLTFLLLYILPGDAAMARIGQEVGAGAVSEADLNDLREEFGLNDPVHVQYLKRLGSALRGDLGESAANGQSVTSIIREVSPYTIELAALAMLVATVLAASVALLAAYTRREWLKGVVLAVPTVGIGLPNFWFGLMLMTLFSFHLGWLPAGGAGGPREIVLPAITLALAPASIMAQVFSASLEHAYVQPYSTMATAKGATRARTLFRHATRNAVIPALTVAGNIVGTLIVASVVVETVFARPGLGQVLLDAVFDADLNVVLGVVLISAVLVVGVNLIVDLSYSLIDPRIRTVRRRQASEEVVV